MIPLLFCLPFNIRTNFINTITGHASPGRTSPPEAIYEVVPRGATASSSKLSVVDPVDHDGLNKDVLNKTFVVSIELIKERERAKT